MDGHSYPKGAVVLQMLRFVMGEEPFFRTLEHFLHKYAFEAVDTHDLMKTIKEVTGQNLDWFFKQCIYKPGHPFFKVSYSWDENTSILNLKINQIQDYSRGIPVYTLPVNIGITTAAGKIVKKVWIKEKANSYEFKVKEKPLLVRFDEGNWLIKEWVFDKSLEELLYQLKNDDVIGRMWAATELEKYNDNAQAFAGLKESGEKDPFRHVRKNAVVTIGKLKDRDLISFFKEKSSDSDSKVRVEALRALGEFRDSGLVEFFKERFKRDDSYLAQAEALRSIGKCGDKTSVSFLENAGKMKSPRRMFSRVVKAAIEEINKK